MPESPGGGDTGAPPQATEIENPKTDQTAADPLVLSKNVWKKLAKQQRFQVKKAEKKAAVKEQKQRNVERKHKEWEESLVEILGWVVYNHIDASSIGACRPRIFFINGFLCFLENEWQRNGERERERRRHFKEKMSLEEAHHHRRPWIRAWRKKEMNEGRGREEHEILCSK
ncbi:hypothetical protein D0Y65_041662 [Glycine soja]|uniref:Uncharacterized protein n=1 Tax=Glycine soja TaxID=3848 RepID=A0A445GWU2_GLYSO|nr:hypothetical protein D0Y65_041662 [Glycine soja]